MRPISSLRDNENYPELDETARLRAMSAQESLRQWLELQSAIPSFHREAARHAKKNS